MTPTDAVQGWLALEHEAVWLYPVIGARHDTLSRSARRSYDAHRNARDGLLARLNRAGAEPVAVALSYDVGSLKTAADARAVARRLERRIEAACLTLAGVSEADERASATASLRRAALAELTWGGRPAAFPGLAT